VREQGDPRDRLLHAVEAAGLRGTNAADCPQSDVRALIEEGDVTDIDGVLFSNAALDDLARRVTVLAEEFVANHPLRYGIDKEEVRQRVRFPHPAALFNSVLTKISKDRSIFIRNNLVRSGTPELQLHGEVAEEVKRLEEIIRRPGLLFDRQAAIEKTWRGKSDFTDALQLLRDTGVVERVGNDGYVHRDALDRCVAELANWFETHRELGVGDFKDIFGVSRKHAIPLLEYFDERRITLRDGNIRRRGPRLSSRGNSG
ncbi:MAG: SelB C-terminal domain-containing protein, partial [bacterium]